VNSDESGRLATAALDRTFQGKSEMGRSETPPSDEQPKSAYLIGQNVATAKACPLCVVICYLLLVICASVGSGKVTTTYK
jgi:hypothetical protein